MPFCPRCKYEFVDGVNRCADCQIDLVEELPANVEPKKNFRWVPLQPLPGPVYAEMITEALEKQEIPCLVQKDFLSSAYGGHGTISGGLETVILVPEDRKEESEEILRQMLDGI